MRRGDAAYRRASLALFLAGFSTFSLLWCAQPLLPEFARDFGLSAQASSLAQSLTAGALAASIMVAGAVSQVVGRRGLMFVSMTAAALLNLATAFAGDWDLILAARLLEGIALGGVPAIAMAYLAEEVDPRDMARAMGLYVAGTAFGGMIGRVAIGAIAELASWREAMGIVGAVDLAAAIGFILLLPPSRHFVAQRGLDLRFHLDAWVGHLRKPALLKLFLTAFLLMSVFVSLYNYAGFHLSEPPYGLGQGAISALFLAYGFGIWSSSQAGALAERFGARGVLAGGFALMAAGAGLSLATPLPAFVLGVILMTIGFFAAHAVASGWVGRLAGSAKGHAASLYLLFYYLGATFTGWGTGWFWGHVGWIGVVGFTGALALVGIGLAMTMRRS
jgi:YNFM family putative membrane transporter